MEGCQNRRTPINAGHLHECATSSRDKVADATTVNLHAAATLARKQTRLLRRFSRFTILLHKHSSKMMKLFHID